VKKKSDNDMDWNDYYDLKPQGKPSDAIGDIIKERDELRAKLAELEDEAEKDGEKIVQLKIAVDKASDKIAALEEENARLNEALRERLDTVNPTGAGTSISFFYCAAQAYKHELAQARALLDQAEKALKFERILERDRIFEESGCPGFDGPMKITTRFDDILTAIREFKEGK
jgi:DNA repair exonuclease SbcCD ATPase subunit